MELKGTLDIFLINKNVLLVTNGYQEVSWKRLIDWFDLSQQVSWNMRKCSLTSFFN